MDAAVDRLEVKIVQASGLKSVESGAPSAYAEVSAFVRCPCTVCVVFAYHP